MARWDINRLAEMEVFVRVMELGNFSAAAREFRMTPSAVSKLLTRLETRLQARLLNRTTRRLMPTPEGHSFYEQCVRILADVEDAERSTSGQGDPRGRLRVSASVPFAQGVLFPLVNEFLARFSGIALDIVLTDQVVNLVEERTDVAIRHGPLESSRLVARKLGETRMVVVASPHYLERHGLPTQPDDLTRHNLLDFGYTRTLKGWPFIVNGSQQIISPQGNLTASDGEALRQLAVAGAGLARLDEFQVVDDIASGRLVPVLQAFNPGDTDPVHAVFLGQGTQMPLRVRVFLDYLVANVRLT
ncbi:HTH-type transcriptional regulator DmlR [Pseudomonas fluorescens]|uniref:HTH-type transcriptional regulator DmlR n=1 Tax=Pseudomonas fluorescens TaxID=294 RepID=A0A5E7T3J1_PSEFL|nr:LysR family transcriptional regulator [Pseudomonas fluorescens]VVP93306.1 HTH-type transcriptional regulator DmlR [Pseudomonas fluorescens]